LITDDLRALPELQTVVEAKVAISPILLKALVERNVIDEEEALEKLEEAAENRSWLKSTIYRRAKTYSNNGDRHVDGLPNLQEDIPAASQP